METIGYDIASEKKSNLISMAISLTVHLLIIFFVVYLPFFHRPQISMPSVLDVTLYDFPEEFSGDITAGEVMPVEKPPEQTELVDPSDAEIKRMKKRKNDRKPPAKKKDADAFTMRKGMFPGGKGTTSGSLKLDTADFPFMYYLSMLKNRISENWIPPFGSVKSGETKRVVIGFRIERRGHVLTPVVEEGSGDDALDQSAVRAVIVSDPFPPLPENYKEATLGIHFGFVCEM